MCPSSMGRGKRCLKSLRLFQFWLYRTILYTGLCLLLFSWVWLYYHHFEAGWWELHTIFKMRVQKEFLLWHKNLFLLNSLPSSSYHLVCFCWDLCLQLVELLQVPKHSWMGRSYFETHNYVHMIGLLFCCSLPAPSHFMYVALHLSAVTCATLPGSSKFCCSSSVVLSFCYSE